ncbi:MAG: hypothetical protein ABJR05_09285 [Balneola sp.]
MNNQLFALLILIGLTSSVTFGQRISADRPGAGFSTFTVPSKTLYLESGASISSDFSDIGQVFLRTGLSDDLEIQFNVGSLLFIDGVDKPRVAVQSLALKYSLGSFAEEKLNLSLYSRTNLPFFNNDYEYYLTRFMILGDYSINDTWGINSNFGYGDFVDGLNNGSFNFNITPGFSVNDNTAAYFGYAVTFDENFSSDLIEAGMVHFLNPSFQLDAGFIYSDGDDLFLTIGIAKRI